MCRTGRIGREAVPEGKSGRLCQNERPHPIRRIVPVGGMVRISGGKAYQGRARGHGVVVPGVFSVRALAAGKSDLDACGNGSDLRAASSGGCACDARCQMRRMLPVPYWQTICQRHPALRSTMRHISRWMAGLAWCSSTRRGAGRTERPGGGACGRRGAPRW